MLAWNARSRNQPVRVRKPVNTKAVTTTSRPSTPRVLPMDFLIGVMPNTFLVAAGGGCDR